MRDLISKRRAERSRAERVHLKEERRKKTETRVLASRGEEEREETSHFPIPHVEEEWREG